MPGPIGGLFISSFGGALGFRAYQGVLPAQGVQPTVTNQTLIDVQRWELQKLAFEDDTTHTGSFGAQGNAIDCLTFRCAAELLWDINNPPLFVSEFGANVSSVPLFDTGYQFWAYVGSGLNYPSDLQAGYYYCPSAKRRMITTVVDAGGKKKIRARIDVMGNAPLFALGGTVTDVLYYNAYIAHCATRNWLW